MYFQIEKYIQEIIKMYINVLDLKKKKMIKKKTIIEKKTMKKMKMMQD